MGTKPYEAAAGAVPTVPRGGPFRAFGHRDFTLFWGGSILAFTSLAMLILVRGQLMLDLTGSPFLVSAISAVPGLPMLFLALFGGVLADRFNRKVILIAAESVNLVIHLITAMLVLTETIQVWQLFLLALFNGIFFSISLPARNALIPNLLRTEDLASGVALATTIFSGSQLIGPALAGFVMSDYGMGFAFLVPAFLLVPALVVFGLMHVRQEKTDGASQDSVVQSILEGFSWVQRHPVVLGLLLMGMAATMFGIPYQALLPVFARDLLSGPGASLGFLGLPESAHQVLTPKLGLGLIAAATGLGGIIGSLTVATLGDSRYRGLLLVGGGIGFGIFIALFAASPLFLLSVGLAFVLGLLFQLFMTSNFTLVQILSPDYIRGRVLSIRFLIFGLMPAGQFLVGIWAEVFGTSAAVAAMGGLSTLFMIAVVLSIPALRRL